MRWGVLVSLVSLPILGLSAGTEAERVGPLNPSGMAVADDRQEMAIVADSKGNCFVAFSALRTDVNRSSVYFASIPAGGGLNGPAQALTPPRSGSPSLIQVGDALHLTWLEAMEGKKFQVGHRRSRDKGKTWSEPVYMSAGISSRKPMLTSATGGTLFAFLVTSQGGENQPDGIWCYRSGDEGATWQRVFPQNKAAGLVSELSPLADSASVNLSWVETRPQTFNLMFNRSTDGGKTWHADPVVVSASQYPVAQVRLSSARGAFILFWKETGAGGDRILTSVSSDGGKSWKSPLEILERVRGLTYQVSVGPDNAFLIWVEERVTGPDRRFDLKLAQFEVSRLNRTDGAVIKTATWTNTYLFRPDFLSLTKGEDLVAAAVVKELTSYSSLFAISSGKASSGGIVPIGPDEGERNRTLVAVVELPEGLGVLYREQPRRIVPQQDWPGELIFRRVPLSK
ncbi:MAG: hypothetical protein EHM61_06815 [Acidobacteria bacterium]|nr:MAG: hypothetical protein EHM61_06815 [Acidobacteriota bacterium]